MTGRRAFLAAFGAAPLLALGKRASFDVTEFGAVGDGVKLDTAALQRAIDACTANGGGTVLLPPGRYLSGTIELKSGVELHLAPGATLLGSANLADYPVRIPAVRSFTDTYTEKSLIYAEKATDIAITGLGKMDGQGAKFSGPYKVRPYMLRIIDCKRVTVTGVTIVDSPMWVQHYLACESVIIRGIRVFSRVNHNNDGIDIDGCERVTISDCDIHSGDDAIVLKSTLDRVTRHVTVTNCVIASDCNAFKLGTESNGGFENIAFSNSSIHSTKLAGIAIELVDGGRLERVSATGIVMDGVAAPIFIRLGNRARPFTENGAKPGVGSLRDVTLTNIQAIRCGRTGCAVSGIPGHCIENVAMTDVRLRFAGGGAKELVTRIPGEEEAKYPEYRMFGDLPAFAFFCRHVRGLRMHGIEAACEKPDPRPAVVFDDVERATFTGFRALSPIEAMLRVRSGAAIEVRDNDQRGVAQPFDRSTW